MKSLKRLDMFGTPVDSFDVGVAVFLMDPKEQAAEG